MASNPRKRPSPTINNGTISSPQTTTTTTTTMGIDTLLAKYARHLPPGGTVTVTLVKGPTSSSVDPIAARKAAAALAKSSSAGAGGGASDNEGASSTTTSSTAASAALGKKFAGATIPLPFPRIAKFPETVTRPDFIQGSLRDGRMYEEDVPKAKDESDEEESTAYRPSNDDGEGTDPNNPNASSSAATNKKRKKRWRKHDVRPRRWVVQEKSEFFERVAARRRKARRMGAMGGASTNVGDEDDAVEGGKLSNQYHGVMESNTSKYVILSVAPPGNGGASAAVAGQSTPASKYATEQISIQPIYGFHTFSQPYKFASLTMEEAENAIEQQRNVVTRYMMHGRFSSQAADKTEAAAALASGVAVSGRGNRPMGPPPKAMSRARLLGKLAGGDDKDVDDGDDVMADVKFSTSRGTSRARKELLSSMADEGITVDDDGVLGGANDTEFGGRRRFARVAVDKSADVDGGSAKKKGKGGDQEKGGGTATGFEAGAMEEGFYQRDVSAEYEALDYDANEQFDDDDVNLGEDEINDEGGGFGGDFGDSGDEMFDSDEEEGSDDDMFKGMASSAGLKAMIAKAGGELPAKPEDGAAATAGADATDGQKADSPEGEAATAKGEKGINKIMDAAKKTAEEMEKKKAQEAEAASAATKAKEVKAMGIEKDKDGLRIISMEAVRREIWLNSGAIKSKRLMKKFDVTNKYPERQALFRSIVMELCTMKKDADGNKLVLKQHYAKSG